MVTSVSQTSLLKRNMYKRGGRGGSYKVENEQRQMKIRFYVNVTNTFTHGMLRYQSHVDIQYKRSRSIHFTDKYIYFTCMYGKYGIKRRLVYRWSFLLIWSFRFR